MFFIDAWASSTDLSDIMFIVISDGEAPSFLMAFSVNMLFLMSKQDDVWTDSVT